MPCCYILYSSAINKYYVGASKGSAPERLELHLRKEFGTHRFTAQTNDWQIFIELSTPSYRQALRMEKKIKSMKSRKYIQDLYKYAELREKLANSTLE